MAKPFESPTHRQKRITFELSVFCFVPRGEKAGSFASWLKCLVSYACKPARPNHPRPAFGMSAFSNTPITRCIGYYSQSGVEPILGLFIARHYVSVLFF